jgi:hypothetical protein
VLKVLDKFLDRTPHVGTLEVVSSALQKREPRAAARSGPRNTPDGNSEVAEGTRCERPGTISPFGAERGYLIDNHAFESDAALRITRESRFLNGRNTMRVEIEMGRKILRHEIIRLTQTHFCCLRHFSLGSRPRYRPAQAFGTGIKHD